MRQLPDKADCVGKQKWLLVRQSDLARRGVESGKQLVLDQDFGTCQPAEERRFADVSITNDGRVWHRRALAILPLGRARFAHSFQFAFEPVDLEADFAFVLLELAFSLA